MELVEYPTSFHSIVGRICKNLNLQEIKILSMCSHEWLRATEPFLVEESEIHNILSTNRILHLETAQRTYRNFFFHDLSSRTTVKNLELLVTWYRKTKKQNEYFRLSSIKFQNIVLTSEAAKYLNCFDSLNSLEIYACDLAFDKGVFLVLEIRVLKVQVFDFNDKWNHFIESFWETNPNLKCILE